MSNIAGSFSLPRNDDDIEELSKRLDTLDENKLDATELPNAINDALAQAKESGEFDGEDGNSGVYLGSGDMPEDCNVQVDPDGDVFAIEDIAQEVMDILPIVSHEMDSKSANLFNNADPEIISNSWLNVNGAIYNASYIYISGYIPIVNGKTYTLPVYKAHFGWSTTGYIVLYDAEKNFIGNASGALTDELLTVTINNVDAAYFRTTFGANSSLKCSIQNMMVVEGTEYPSEFIPYSEQVTYPVLGIKLAKDYIQSLLNPLYKKTIIWNGDSICAGKAFDDEENAWAGRIANRNSMIYKNYAVGGGTITENVTFNGTVMHSVCGSLDTMFVEYPNADYIIFEGGTNDADIIGSHLANNTPEKFGAFNESQFNGNFDSGTFCGALESIFYRATNYWKGKKIGFIIAHKMGWSSTGYGSENNNRRNYFETAMQICKKWGIPVLNLWDECYLNPSLSHMYDTQATWQENKESGSLYADGQHLLSAGYDYTADIVNNWLKTL